MSATPASLDHIFDRFTDRARKVMALANQEAQRFNHEFIGTEHILLGLVKDGCGVGANVLKNLNVDLQKVRIEVGKLVKPCPDEVTAGKIPRTPRANRVLQYALEEAEALKHKYVGTGHLVLGILREHEAVGAQVLMNLGLNLEEVRVEVINLLGCEDPKTLEPAAKSEPIITPQELKNDLARILERLTECVEMIRSYDKKRRLVKFPKKAKANSKRAPKAKGK